MRDIKEMAKELEDKKILDRRQFGFRKGKGTIEAVYVLTEITKENIRKKKGKIMVCFEDLKERLINEKEKV